MTLAALLQFFGRLTRPALLVWAPLIVLFALGTAANLSLDTGGPLRYVLRQLDLTQEGTVGAWLSSVLLLSISIGAFVAAMLARERSNRRTWSAGCLGWLAISLMFLLLSWDEHAAFHERLGSFEALNAFGGRLSDWVGVFVLPLVGFMVFMIVFAKREFARDMLSTAMLAAGALLYLTIPLQEEIETRMRWRGDEDPGTYVRPVHLAVIEESTELLASLLVLIAILRFIRRQRDSSARGGRNPWLVSPIPWVVVGGGWIVRLAWVRFAALNFEVRASYLDPSYWLAGASLTVGGLVAWMWWRHASSNVGPSPISVSWAVALTGFAVFVAADYGSGLVLRSLAGHAVSGAGVSALLSLIALAFGARWFAIARSGGERMSYTVWVIASIGAAWLSGPASALCASAAWAGFADGVMQRPEWEGEAAESVSLQPEATAPR
jgi:hypothetical protein